MNGDPSNKKNQFIYTLFYSVLVVLTAQINVHLFTRNFVASAGVIVFALLMLLLDEFAAMPVMFLSATGVMVTRSIAGAELGTYKTAGATEDAVIVRLERNVPQRIRVFIWLEGQDADCTGATENLRFAVNLQLAGANS